MMDEDDIDHLEKGSGMYVVSIHLVDLAYGGPEEGGWWYCHGQPVTVPLLELPEEFRFPRYFSDERKEEMTEYCCKLQEVLDETINKGRRSISSVLSEGKYRAIQQDGHPHPWPEERPHYE